MTAVRDSSHETECGQSHCRVPHRRLSEPFDVLTLDLQARVDALTARGSQVSHSTSHTAEHSTSGPRGKGSSGSSIHSSAVAKLGAGTAVLEAAWETDDTLFIPAIADGICNAVVFWNEADMGAGYTLTSFETQIITPQTPSESHTPGSIPQRAIFCVGRRLQFR